MLRVLCKKLKTFEKLTFFCLVMVEGERIKVGLQTELFGEDGPAERCDAQI